MGGAVVGRPAAFLLARSVNIGDVGEGMSSPSSPMLSSATGGGGEKTDGALDSDPVADSVA